MSFPSKKEAMLLLKSLIRIVEEFVTMAAADLFVKQLIVASFKEVAKASKSATHSSTEVATTISSRFKLVQDSNSVRCPAHQSY